jgi:Sulfotransferase family
VRSGLSAETTFFVHVMKTGGTTFVQHIEANFRPDEVYPPAERGPQRRASYYMIDQLLNLPAERRRTIKAYVGHFPYVVSTLLEPRPITYTILREPVARIVSVLKDFKRYEPRLADLTLEEIYDDPWVFPMVVHNYQAKLFAMTRDDKLESHFDIIDVDDDRLRIARENLDQIAVLGLQEHYDDFVADVQHRFGWEYEPVPSLRVSTEGWDVSPAFRRRVAADNPADLAFYEYATELYARRQAKRSRSTS